MSKTSDKPCRHYQTEQGCRNDPCYFAHRLATPDELKKLFHPCEGCKTPSLLKLCEDCFAKQQEALGLQKCSNGCHVWTEYELCRPCYLDSFYECRSFG